MKLEDDKKALTCSNPGHCAVLFSSGPICFIRQTV